MSIAQGFKFMYLKSFDVADTCNIFMVAPRENPGYGDGVGVNRLRCFYLAVFCFVVFFSTAKLSDLFIFLIYIDDLSTTLDTATLETFTRVLHQLKIS